MTKYFYIGILALGLAGCSSVQLYVDDAYHWPDKTSEKTTPVTPTTQNTPTTPNTQNTPSSPTSAPSLEFTNVQDTTITVKIHR